MRQLHKSCCGHLLSWIKNCQSWWFRGDADKRCTSAKSLKGAMGKSGGATRKQTLDLVARALLRKLPSTTCDWNVSETRARQDTRADAQGRPAFIIITKWKKNSTHLGGGLTLFGVSPLLSPFSLPCPSKLVLAAVPGLEPTGLPTPGSVFNAGNCMDPPLPWRCCVE